MTHFTPGGDLDDFVAYRAGASYTCAPGNNLVNTQAVAANTLYAHPVFIERAASIEALGIGVGTPVAAALGRVALYATRQDVPAPGNLLFGGATDLDFNSAAFTTLIQTIGTPVRVSRGIVWLVSIFNGAAQPRVLWGGVANGPMSLLPGRVLGSASLGGALSNEGPSQQVVCVSAAHTFGTAFPASFPTPIFGPHWAPHIAWRHA